MTTPPPKPLPPSARLTDNWFRVLQGIDRKAAGRVVWVSVPDGDDAIAGELCRAGYLRTGHFFDGCESPYHYWITPAGRAALQAMEEDG